MGLTGPYGVSPAINQITASGDDHSAARSSESHASSQSERRFALYAEFGLMYRVMVLLDLLIGMRCGELLVLQWRDFDFAKKTVKIHKAICHQHVGPVETREKRASRAAGRRHDCGTSRLSYPE